MNTAILKTMRAEQRPLTYIGTKAGRILGLFLVLACAAAVGSGQLITRETRQVTAANICVDGDLPGDLFCSGGVRSDVGNHSVNSISHSNNFDGTPQSPAEARTAGRSGSREIAANASIRYVFDRFLPTYTYVSGLSIFEIDIVVLGAGDVYFDFVLPPGFLEIESNIEFESVHPITLTSDIFALISSCRPDCSQFENRTTLFHADSQLQGGFFTHTLTANANSINPALDTSALTHQIVNITGNGFLRTKTWRYDQFQGRIFLGHFNAGETFTIEYFMSADTYSNVPGFQTRAAAAINDPFFLSTDLLPQQDLFSFSFIPAEDPTPVPETKVGVCHREGNRGFHLIEVAPQAVQPHRDHGDALPGESVPHRPGYRFNASCEQVIT